MLRTLGWLGGIALASPAWAGGWSSGGGEAQGDERNPWFIESFEPGLSPQMVTYCVELDPDAFHLSRGAVRGAVRSALDAWRSDLQFAAYPSNGGVGEVRSGFQAFVERRCRDDIDLKFQFGILSAEQRAALERRGQDPRDFVGLAIREDYDPVQMRGRGYIYLAADTGELRPHGEDMRDRPWTVQVVKSVLMHELGHVFGLSHSGDEYSVMGAGFPAWAVSERNEYPDWFLPSAYFGRGESGSRLRFIHAESQLRSLFGVPEAFDILAFRLNGQTLSVYASSGLVARAPEENSDSSSDSEPTDLPGLTSESERWVLIGTADFHQDEVQVRESAVQVWMPPDQARFPRAENRLLRGAEIVRRRLAGTYTSRLGGDPFPVIFHTGPNTFDLDAIIGGRIVLGIFGLHVASGGGDSTSGSGSAGTSNLKGSSQSYGQGR